MTLVTAAFESFSDNSFTEVLLAFDSSQVNLIYNFVVLVVENSKFGAISDVAKKRGTGIVISWKNGFSKQSIEQSAFARRSAT